MASDRVPVDLLPMPNEIIDDMFGYLRPIELIGAFGLMSIDLCRISSDPGSRN